MQQDIFEDIAVVEDVAGSDQRLIFGCWFFKICTSLLHQRSVLLCSVPDRYFSLLHCGPIVACTIHPQGIFNFLWYSGKLWALNSRPLLIRRLE